MKIRLLSVVLAVLLVFPGAAFAEIYEWPELKAAFSECTIEMLYSIKTLLDTEIASREDKDKEVVVPVGEYIVGDDIPAGVYTVTTGDHYTSIEIFDNEKRVQDFDFMDAGTIGKLTLKNGQRVVIEYQSVTFSTYKGLSF